MILLLVSEGLRALGFLIDQRRAQQASLSNLEVLGRTTMLAAPIVYTGIGLWSKSDRDGKNSGRNGTSALTEIITELHM